MKWKLLFWGLLLFGAAPVIGLHAGQKNSDVDEIGRRDINKGSINFTSLEKEIALGRSMAAEVEKQVKLITDPEVTEYVSRVGQNIVRNSDAKSPSLSKLSTLKRSMLSLYQAGSYT